MFFTIVSNSSVKPKKLTSWQLGLNKIVNISPLSPLINLSALFAIIFVLSCKENYKGYTINGKIEDAQKPTRVYLKNDHTGVIKDSTIIDDNGNFYFEGITEYPQRYAVIYKSSVGMQDHFVWIENTTIEIIGKLSDIDNIRIKSGKEQVLLEKMESEEAFFDSEYTRLTKEKKYDSIRSLIKQLFKVKLDFCNKNPNSFMVVEMLYRIRNEIKKDSLGLILKKMDDSILNSNYGQSLLLYSKSPELEVNKHYIDFTAQSLVGEDISVSELLKKEKPVLIIFGGLACMQEHGRKILKDFNSRYKDNIEIIAFTFARNRNEWVADSKYPLDITLLSDMKGDHSPIKIQYDVQATPTVYIIDKDGIIAWKSIGYGEDVNKAAIKLFNE